MGNRGDLKSRQDFHGNIRALLEWMVVSQEQAATMLDGGGEVQAIGHFQIEVGNRSDPGGPFAHNWREGKGTNIRIAEKRFVIGNQFDVASGERTGKAFGPRQIAEGDLVPSCPQRSHAGRDFGAPGRMLLYEIDDAIGVEANHHDFCLPGFRAALASV
jgi:hypothetical protein